MVGIYLYFNGTCKNALDMYEKAFGVKAGEIRRYGEVPPNQDFHFEESEKDLILVSRFALGETTILCSDLKDRALVGANTCIHITNEDEDFIKNAWEVLKENGKIYMGLQPTFFAKIHGSLQDRFGVNWMFSVLKPH